MEEKLTIKRVAIRKDNPVKSVKNRLSAIAANLNNEVEEFTKFVPNIMLAPSTQATYLTMFKKYIVRTIVLNHQYYDVYALNPVTVYGLALERNNLLYDFMIILDTSYLKCDTKDITLKLAKEHTMDIVNVALNELTF